jgi:hypothetical protein
VVWRDARRQIDVFGGGAHQHGNVGQNLDYQIGDQRIMARMPDGFRSVAAGASGA